MESIPCGVRAVLAAKQKKKKKKQQNLLNIRQAVIALGLISIYDKKREQIGKYMASNFGVWLVIWKNP